MKYRITETRYSADREPLTMVVLHYARRSDFEQAVFDVLQRENMRSIVVRASVDETMRYYVGYLITMVLTGAKSPSIVLGWDDNDVLYTAYAEREKQR